MAGSPGPSTHELVEKYEQAKRRRVANQKNITRHHIQWSKILKADVTETIGLRDGAWGYPITVYSVRMVAAMRARASDRGFRLRCVTDLATNELVVWLERKVGMSKSSHQPSKVSAMPAGRKG